MPPLSPHHRAHRTGNKCGSVAGVRIPGNNPAGTSSGNRLDPAAKERRPEERDILFGPTPARPGQALEASPTRPERPDRTHPGEHVAGRPPETPATGRGPGRPRGSHGFSASGRAPAEAPRAAAPSTSDEGGAPRENGPNGRRARSPRAWPAAPPASASAGPPAPPPPWCGRRGRAAKQPAPAHSALLPQRRGERGPTHCAGARDSQASPIQPGAAPPTQPGRLERPDFAIAGGRRGAGQWTEPEHLAFSGAAPPPLPDDAKHSRASRGCE